MTGITGTGRFDDFTPKLWTSLRQGYGSAEFRSDLTAGITVAIVALPLSLALGIASGAGPFEGLLTAIIGGFCISAFGGSRVQIGGPTGAFVVIVATVIAQHGYDGLVLATLMAGAMLVIAGYARLGQAMRFIPQPVIIGFTAGIALTIASTQVKEFLGLDLAVVPADFIPKWLAYGEAIGTTQLPTLAVGAASLTALIALRRYAPRLPGFLIVVVAAAAAVVVLNLPVATVGTRFPVMPHGIPMPHLPDFGWDKVRHVLPSAFTIAFLAGIEALLSATVADGMTGYRHRSNQELVGQGIANLASALFGGLPATGALARTATNVRAGGVTPVSGLVHAVLLLGLLLVGGDLVRLVPMAALAAILFLVAWGMSEIDRFRALLRMPLGDRGVLLLTFGLTVMVDLTVAIGVGVTLASLSFVAQLSRTVTFGEPVEDAGQRADLPSGVEVFRIAGPLFFAVTDNLLQLFRRVGQQPQVLILRLSEMPFLDASAAGTLAGVIATANTRGTRVILAGVQLQPATMLRRAKVRIDRKGLWRVRDYAAALTLARSLTERGEQPLE